MSVNVVASLLGPAVHDVVEKSVNLRMSARKEATKLLRVEVKTDVLLSDPLHSELCSSHAANHAMESLPSVPMHILHAHATSRKSSSTSSFRKPQSLPSQSSKGSHGTRIKGLGFSHGSSSGQRSQRSFPVWSLGHRSATSWSGSVWPGEM